MDYTAPDEYPYENTPSADTPIMAEALNDVVEALVDLGGPSGRVADLEANPIVTADRSGAQPGTVYAFALNEDGDYVLSPTAHLDGTQDNGSIWVTAVSDSRNAANFEQTSATATALRFNQTGTGPLAKWRSQGSDVGFIDNGGQFRLIPADNARAVSVESPDWLANRPFGYGNKDGIFYVNTFTDNSGVATVGGVYQSFTKMFGGNAIKNGPGNFDAFWASLTHHGADEAGLFIGDVTGDAGGNLWGGHFVLTANTAEAVMVGHSVELNNNATGATKSKRALHLRSGGTQDVTVGLLLDTATGAAGSFADFLVARGADQAVKFSVSKAGAVQLASSLTATGTITSGGAITASSNSDGANVLRLNMDRPWVFKQIGTAGTTVLRLSPEQSDRVFRITGPNGSVRAIELTASDTAANSNVRFCVDAGQKLGFFNAAVTTQKSGWATATGTATRATFDTATVTLPQLAERVKALIDDLHATAGYGLLGA